MYMFVRAKTQGPSYALCWLSTFFKHSLRLDHWLTICIHTTDHFQCSTLHPIIHPFQIQECAHISIDEDKNWNDVSGQIAEPKKATNFLD